MLNPVVAIYLKVKPDKKLCLQIVTSRCIILVPTTSGTSLPSPQPTAVRQCCPRLSFQKQLKSVRLQSAPPCGWAVGYNRDQPVCQASYSTRVQRQKSVQEYRQTGTCPGCRGVPKCWELAGNGQWSYWSTKQLFWIRGGRLTSLDAS